jgi:hypothetical protein
MVYRKFSTLKFSRTYIGGSKKRELEMFLDVQGTKEDNSECNWLEYRRLLMTYCDDILNIILSWKYISGILRIVFAGLAALVSLINPIYSIIILAVAAGFHFLYIYLKNKEMKRLSEYNFSLNTINQQTGLALSIN